MRGSGSPGLGRKASNASETCARRGRSQHALDGGGARAHSRPVSGRDAFIRPQTTSRPALCPSNFPAAGVHPPFGSHKMFNPRALRRRRCLLCLLTAAYSLRPRSPLATHARFHASLADVAGPRPNGRRRAGPRSRRCGSHPPLKGSTPARIRSPLHPAKTQELRGWTPRRAPHAAAYGPPPIAGAAGAPDASQLSPPVARHPTGTPIARPAQPPPQDRTRPRQLLLAAAADRSRARGRQYRARGADPRGVLGGGLSLRGGGGSRRGGTDRVVVADPRLRSCFARRRRRRATPPPLPFPDGCRGAG